MQKRNGLPMVRFLCLSDRLKHESWFTSPPEALPPGITSTFPSMIMISHCFLTRARGLGSSSAQLRARSHRAARRLKYPPDALFGAMQQLLHELSAISEEMSDLASCRVLGVYIALGHCDDRQRDSTTCVTRLKRTLRGSTHYSFSSRCLGAHLILSSYQSRMYASTHFYCPNIAARRSCMSVCSLR